MPRKTKEGRRQYAREFYERTKHLTTEKRKARNARAVRNWRHNNREDSMLCAARSRAKRLGMEFDLELSDIFIPDRCPILEIPLSWTIGKQHDGTPALDRIDNSKGYVKGNVAVISHKANRNKSNLSLEDIQRLYEYSL